MEHFWEWFAYILGASLVLAFKYVRYLHHYGEGDFVRTYWKKATIEWIFGNPAQQKKVGSQTPISLVTTIGIVWLVGGWVVYGGLVDALPEGIADDVNRQAFAFTTGSLAEFIAPPVGQALVGAIVKVFKK